MTRIKLTYKETDKLQLWSNTWLKFNQTKCKVTERGHSERPTYECDIAGKKRDSICE